MYDVWRLPTPSPSPSFHVWECDSNIAIWFIDFRMPFDIYRIIHDGLSMNGERERKKNNAIFLNAFSQPSTFNHHTRCVCVCVGECKLFQNENIYDEKLFDMEQFPELIIIVPLIVYVNRCWWYCCCRSSVVRRRRHICRSLVCSMSVYPCGT